MKIAIISDSHDNIANFKKAVSFIEKQKIKTIIHCGDVTTPKTLKNGFEGFSGKVHLVWGNVDKDHFKTNQDFSEEFPQINFWGNVGEIEINKKKITFCHFPEVARALAKTGKHNLVFYGHTHKPWEEKINGVEVINPGNLTGIMYKATFAIYDIKENKAELKILEKLE